MMKSHSHGMALCITLLHNVVQPDEVYAESFHWNKSVVQNSISGAQLAKKIKDQEDALRKKYGNKQLSYYHVSYQDLQDIIKNATKRVFGELANRLVSEDELAKAFHRHEEEVLASLHQRGAEAYGKIQLKPDELAKRIDEHETKLLQKYGGKDQLDYYTVTYGELEDIIMKASQDLLKREGNIFTTKAQLKILFDQHEDAVLVMLKKQRAANQSFWWWLTRS